MMLAHRKNERGSATLELAILGPGLLLFIGLIVFGGRVAIAGQSVQQAADEAARVASIARTQADANRQAAAAAKNTLAKQGLECAGLRVAVNTSGFNADVGQTTNVTATVSCQVRGGDLMVPGVPGTRTVTASANSPIDTWRER